MEIVKGICACCSSNKVIEEIRKNKLRKVLLSLFEKFIDADALEDVVYTFQLCPLCYEKLMVVASYANTIENHNKDQGSCAVCGGLEELYKTNHWSYFQKLYEDFENKNKKALICSKCLLFLEQRNVIKQQLFKKYPTLGLHSHNGRSSRRNKRICEMISIDSSDEERLSNVQDDSQHNGRRSRRSMRLSETISIGSSDEERLLDGQDKSIIKKLKSLKQQKAPMKKNYSRDKKLYEHIMYVSLPVCNFSKTNKSRYKIGKTKGTDAESDVGHISGRTGTGRPFFKIRFKPLKKPLGSSTPSKFPSRPSTPSESLSRPSTSSKLPTYKIITDNIKRHGIKNLSIRILKEDIKNHLSTKNITDSSIRCRKKKAHSDGCLTESDSTTSDSKDEESKVEEGRTDDIKEHARKKCKPMPMSRKMQKLQLECIEEKKQEEKKIEGSSADEDKADDEGSDNEMKVKPQRLRKRKRFEESNSNLSQKIDDDKHKKRRITEDSETDNEEPGNKKDESESKEESLGQDSQKNETQRDERSKENIDIKSKQKTDETKNEEKSLNEDNSIAVQKDGKLKPVKHFRKFSICQDPKSDDKTSKEESEVEERLEGTDDESRVKQKRCDTDKNQSTSEEHKNEFKEKSSSSCEDIDDNENCKAQNGETHAEEDQKENDHEKKSKDKYKPQPLSKKTKDRTQADEDENQNNNHEKKKAKEIGDKPESQSMARMRDKKEDGNDCNSSDEDNENNTKETEKNDLYESSKTETRKEADIKKKYRPKPLSRRTPIIDSVDDEDKRKRDEEKTSQDDPDSVVMAHSTSKTGGVENKEQEQELDKIINKYIDRTVEINASSKIVPDIDKTSETIEDNEQVETDLHNEVDENKDEEKDQVDTGESENTENEDEETETSEDTSIKSQKELGNDAETGSGQESEDSEYRGTKQKSDQIAMVHKTTNHNSSFSDCHQGSDSETAGEKSNIKRTEGPPTKPSDDEIECINEDDGHPKNTEKDTSLSDDKLFEKEYDNSNSSLCGTEKKKKRVTFNDESNVTINID